mgnify:CR=1 FL=1
MKNHALNVLRQIKALNQIKSGLATMAEIDPNSKFAGVYDALLGEVRNIQAEDYRKGFDAISSAGISGILRPR